MIQNGTVTIQNVKTGEHRTFKIATVREGNLEGKRIVSLLTGADNENSYSGFAFVSDDGEIVNVWRKKVSPTFSFYASMMVQAFRSLESVFDAEVETVSAVFVMSGREYSVTLEKRCRCCNRKLTTPASLKAGFGPECAKRLGVAW